MLSAIIPSRNAPSWPFLQRTVDDLFNKAAEEVEVIVILDGFRPDPPLKEQKNLTVVFHPEAQGMRQGINLGASIAKGKYIMKVDDHCMFDAGYDKALKENCDDNWLAVPSRFALHGEQWLEGKERPFKYGPVEYLYLTFPYNLDDQFGFGFHGKKWRGEYGLTGGYYAREKKRKDIRIDDMLSFQGSCWFMHRKRFFENGCMQTEGYFQHQEAQEMCFKVWLSDGGRCVINKKTWYAHLHKGSDYGRGYHMLKHHQIKSNIYSADTWMNNKWSGQTRPMKYVIDKFWPLEAWPEDWDNPKHWENYDYEIWHRANTLRGNKDVRETSSK
jgi:glycosyltransferase involved in cell wall biosynthesis